MEDFSNMVKKKPGTRHGTFNNCWVYIIFRHKYGKIDCILCHKASLNKYLRIEVIQHMLSDHTTVEISNRSK